ncbi:MAG: oligosaccharide flippase family protein [Candidatus Eremiobacteraeota bacterium]|nr:oligosaccharide flippase family protein [Candidatus Eremiobacteraeota bacterium]
MTWIARAKVGPAAVAQTVLARFFILFINLGTSVFTARHFGTEGRGTQAALGLWMPILTYLFMIGLPSGLRFQGRKHQQDQGDLLGASMIIALVIGVFTAIVGIAAMPLLLKHYPAITIYQARTIMLFAPINILGLVFSAMLEVKLDFTFANFSRYAPPIATLVTLVTLASLHHLTPYSAALSYVIPASIVGTITGIYVLRITRATFSRFFIAARRILGYGVRISGADILNTFSSQIDQLLVIGFLSAGQLGAYTVALQASRVLTIFQVSLNSVLLPKAAGLPTHRVIALVARTARLTIAVTMLAAIALVVLMPLLLPGLYGRDFRAAILVSQILAFEAVLSAASATHTQAFTATNRPTMATIFQFAGLATAIPLMLELIPRFGITGAGMALTASSFVRLVIALLCYPFLLKVPIPRIIITREDISYLIDSLRSKRSPAYTPVEPVT